MWLFLYPRMSLRTSDYDFDLPDTLIARRPPERREGARMLVLDRAAGTWAHRAFTDFPGYVRAERGDLAVLNDARVRPARVFANDGRLELLVLETDPGEPGRWVCLVKPGRRARVGAAVRVGARLGTVEAVLEARDGARVIRFDHGPPDLETEGTLPLPSYMDRPRADDADRERYQTVFARTEAARAVAAPTAGLHFTPAILAAVPHVFVTLDVGVGTFRPVKVEDVREHRMHAERFEIAPATADAVNGCRARGGRLFAVGTTSLRVLAGCARDPSGNVVAQRGETNIFLHPPRPVTAVDALLTNFHLPRSTLLMLVCALAGRDLVLAAYHEAIRGGYRFFSYGDCMLIT